MPTVTAGRTAAGRFLLLGVCFSLFLVPAIHAATVLLGSGSQSNHLLILFAPGQALQYEFRHNGNIQTGEQLLEAVIQGTGGTLKITEPRDDQGNFLTLEAARLDWGGTGLLAHFHRYSWGVLVNGFAANGLAAASDGSWTSYFSYQISNGDAGFTSAAVGATERRLAQGDADAYVFTGVFSSPGLAAWQVAHGIPDLQADPDGDGMDNLLEYALRLNPFQSDSSGVIQRGWEQVEGITYLTLTYRRPHDESASVPEGADAGYDGLGYTVETSSDLLTWQSGANHVTQTVTPDASGTMVTVNARVPADAPRKFLRLRVQLP